MDTRQYDRMLADNWQFEGTDGPFEAEERATPVQKAPPLWADLALASAAALLLWIAAAAMTR